MIRLLRCRGLECRAVQRYKALADATPDVHFVGRLATYEYFDIDQVVARALAEFERIMGRRQPPGHIEVPPQHTNDDPARAALTLTAVASNGVAHADAL